MTTLFLDLETYSETDIKCGTHAYAEHAEILLFAYAVDDGPVHVWDATLDPEMPGDLYCHLHDPSSTLVAHNSGFDRTVMGHVLSPDTPIHINRWLDTMVIALQHSLPASLGQLCEVYRMPTDKAKDKDGRRLVQLFCKPRPKNMKLRRATRETHPEDWARFIEYARLDVEAMRELYHRMPRWNRTGEELALWHLDQRINDRGVLIDMDLARAAIDALDRAKTGLSAKASELTDGTVQAATQRAGVLSFLESEFGFTLPDLKASTVEKALEGQDLPDELRELLGVRLQASSTSVKKYRVVFNGVSRDERLRGLHQFCGASRTGRWAGRLAQFQNLPRSTMKAHQIEAGIEALKGGCADLAYGNVTDLCSNAVRGLVIAPPGHKLVVADLSNIEGRVAAWVCDEQWKLDAFAAGQDLYVLAYAKSFQVPPETVTGDQRQVGKVMELALQYGGGANAFATFALVYGIDLDALAGTAYRVIPQSTWAEAEGLLAYFRKKGQKIGMSDPAWTACDSFKRLWREAHPGIVNGWAALDKAVAQALGNQGKAYKACRCVVIRNGSWLRIRLPSGRFLCYPGIESDKGKVSYMGVNQYTRQWSRIKTYGPKLLENIVQAISRDILASAMQPAEDAGYRIVLSVHDELVTEAPDEEEFSHQGLAHIMSTNPGWAEGLPLAAAGFDAYRYRK